MKKLSNLKKMILAVVILVIIAVLLLALDFYLKVFTPYQGFDTPVTLRITKGLSVSAIGKLLQKNGIIANYNYFRIYYRFLAKKKNFKSGEYRFDRPLSVKEVIEMLQEGKVLLHKVTIVEGLTIPEIAAYLSQTIGINRQDFINHAKSVHLLQGLDPQADDLEGYLFPDTYMVDSSITAEGMVNLMVEKFKENFTQSMKWRAEELNLSIREVITLATLVEKESASKEERFLISSVFHNRLRIGMSMGCDPTIIYALKRDNRYSGKLGWAELKYDSPYNTRLYRGLPPGPICNPGYSSIEAALYPENTKYLYFVAKDPHSHYFSATLDEHNRAVRKYIIKHQQD